MGLFDILKCCIPKFESKKNAREKHSRPSAASIPDRSYSGAGIKMEPLLSLPPIPQEMREDQDSIPQEEAPKEEIVQTAPQQRSVSVAQAVSPQAAGQEALPRLTREIKKEKAVATETSALSLPPPLPSPMSQPPVKSIAPQANGAPPLQPLESALSKQIESATHKLKKVKLTQNSDTKAAVEDTAVLPQPQQTQGSGPESITIEPNAKDTFPEKVNENEDVKEFLYGVKYIFIRTDGHITHYGNMVVDELLKFVKSFIERECKGGSSLYYLIKFQYFGGCTDFEEKVVFYIDDAPERTVIHEAGHYKQFDQIKDVVMVLNELNKKGVRLLDLHNIIVNENQHPFSEPPKEIANEYIQIKDGEKKIYLRLKYSESVNKNMQISDQKKTMYKTLKDYKSPQQTGVWAKYFDDIILGIKQTLNLIENLGNGKIFFYDEGKKSWESTEKSGKEDISEFIFSSLISFGTSIMSNGLITQDIRKLWNMLLQAPSSPPSPPHS